MTIDDAGYVIPHNNRDTSKAAAEKAAKFSASLRQRAFHIIALRKRHGATCEHVEDVLSNHAHQSISARLWELAQEMTIFDSLCRRENRSGAEAIVWLATTQVPAAESAPYLEYQRAQFTLEIIRKTLSNLERARTIIPSPVLLDHLDALKSYLVETRHALERISAPPPFRLDYFVTVASPAAQAAAEEDTKTQLILQPPVTSTTSSGAKFVGNDGKEILL